MAINHNTEQDRTELENKLEMSSTDPFNSSSTAYSLFPVTEENNGAELSNTELGNKRNTSGFRQGWKSIKDKLNNVKQFNVSLAEGNTLNQNTKPKVGDILHVRVEKMVAKEMGLSSNNQQWVLITLVDHIGKLRFNFKPASTLLHFEGCIDLIHGSAWEFFTNITDLQSRNSRINRNLQP